MMDFPTRRIMGLFLAISLSGLVACSAPPRNAPASYDTPVVPKLDGHQKPTLEAIDPAYGPNGMLPLFDGHALNRFWDEMPREARIYRKFSESYTYEKIDIPDAKIQGLLCRDDDIVAVDAQNGRLLVLDYDYNIIREVGKIGSGPLEFLWPTAITSADDHIYVLDAVNSRVQVLTQDLAFVEEIKLPRACKTTNQGSSCGDYVDIAVDPSGNIYVSTMAYSGIERDPSISTILCYRADEGDFVHLGRNFCGYLGVDAHGQVYAVNGGVCYRKDNSWGVTTGNAILYRVSPTGMEKVCDYPYASGIEDFVVVDDRLISTNRLGGFADCFALDGEYIESWKELSMETIEESGLISSIALSPSGDIYVAISEIGYLIRVSKKA